MMNTENATILAPDEAHSDPVALDEALDRLRGTGPERGGWLTNHAPMAVEVLARRGLDDQLQHWIDGYADQLTEAPRGISPIAPDAWRDPLGDPVRTGDWIGYFARELVTDDWRTVLIRWWPRLLPGIAAGATHGVIRVGHAVRALRAAETPARVTELGQGLAYWAARWQPLAPAGAGPYRAGDARAALDAVPAVPDQRFGIRHRLAQLADLPGWADTYGSPFADGERTDVEDPVIDRLAAVVDAAVRGYADYGHGNPVMLVHAATAPDAVLRTLPELPASLWRPSLDAAWAAAAAVTSAYRPTGPRPDQAVPVVDRAEAIARAVAGGDPHAIKFADTALDAHLRGGGQSMLRAVAVATRLIAGG